MNVTGQKALRKNMEEAKNQVNENAMNESNELFTILNWSMFLSAKIV